MLDDRSTPRRPAIGPIRRAKVSQHGLEHVEVAVLSRRGSCGERERCLSAPSRWGFEEGAPQLGWAALAGRRAGGRFRDDGSCGVDDAASKEAVV